MRTRHSSHTARYKHESAVNNINMSAGACGDTAASAGRDDLSHMFLDLVCARASLTLCPNSIPSKMRLSLSCKYSTLTQRA